MKEEKKVIVFDIDGTLFDTQKGIIRTFKYVLEQFSVGWDTNKMTNRLIGPPVKKIFVDIFGMTNSDAEKATEMYRKEYVETYIYESEMYKGMKNVILKLNDVGYILCIATMKTQKQVDKLLDINKLYDDFDFVMGAREDGSLKKEDMLRMIKQKYSECGNEFYMVGDTEGDYLASKKAGFIFIGATYGYGEIEKIYEIDTIEGADDLEKILL